jgi:hypothetical protein
MVHTDGKPTIAWADPPGVVRKKRYAVVRARTEREAAAYLPDNYCVLSSHDADPHGRTKNVVIEGVDCRGWTLDGYVIPRLASGLIGCKEYPSRHDAEDAACAAMN